MHVDECAKQTMDNKCCTLLQHSVFIQTTTYLKIKLINTDIQVLKIYTPMKKPKDVKVHNCFSADKFSSMKLPKC